MEWRRLRDAFERVGPIGSLLDGGAGSGEFLRRALMAGYAQRAVGIEPDERNFQLLSQNLGAHSRARTIRGTLLELPASDDSQDMVMSTQVLEHIEDHRRAASELVRVLRPRGHALITVPHPPEPGPNPEHVREGYTVDDLRALFEPLGMSLLHTDFFLTRDTLRRMAKADAMPFHGIFVPVALVDAEKALTADERRARQPYGLLALFQKRDAPR